MKKIFFCGKRDTIFSALALGLVIVLFSVRMVKANGLKWWNIPLWILIAGCIGGAGFMEYYVQRHGDQALFAYSMMSTCLVIVVILTLRIRRFAVEQERKLDLVNYDNLLC